jgi:hypothetical protein
MLFEIKFGGTEPLGSPGGWSELGEILLWGDLRVRLVG